MTSLATGFALSTHPVQAQTMITTPTDGLVAGEVTIPIGSDRIPAYRAMPSGAGPFPVVLVVQEIFGVHEHIKDVCRRLARQGYCAVATELFARQGDVSRLTDFNAIRPIVAAVPDSQVMTDLDATAAWARAESRGRADWLGITGFCWGGRITWLYGAHNQALSAGVAWYGRTVGEPTANQPTNPVDVATRIRAPILGLYGAADTGIPVPTVEQLRTALGSGTRSEIVIYPDMPHAFHADYRPSYRKEAAEDGWRRLLAWFGRNGGVA
ncbi:MAG: carboxymethylenebutenolidase [Alphaproteobacteria bacterium]|nr:MAG: carboxymethylenebutenolidase [Alphaproteobacteria bacterium]